MCWDPWARKLWGELIVSMEKKVTFGVLWKSEGLLSEHVFFNAPFYVCIVVSEKESTKWNGEAEKRKSAERERERDEGHTLNIRAMLLCIYKPVRSNHLCVSIIECSLFNRKMFVHRLLNYKKPLGNTGPTCLVLIVFTPSVVYKMSFQYVMIWGKRSRQIAQYLHQDAQVSF